MRLKAKRLLQIIQNPKLLKQSICDFVYYKKRWNRNHPYIGYIYDYTFNKLGNSRYYNLRKDYENSFRIKDFVNKIGMGDKHIAYISVFGPRFITKYIKDKKIFFCGEEVGNNAIVESYKDYDDYLLDETDLSIGFREYSNKNYIRFPLWITQLIDPGMEIKEIEERINEINNRNIENRNKFCCLIARHDPNGEREETYMILSKLGQIDCPSVFKHNINANIPDYESKRKFMEEYRFNICLENHSDKGYVTEKLIDAFRSKCIPIYNGILTDFDKSIINEDAIINTLDNDWLKKVEKIQSSEEEYRKFISIKPFKERASIILKKHIDLLGNKIKDIFK